METIEIDWIKYDNFFDLWRAHKDHTQLLYVIGDKHYCYIGSIGGHGGAQGLGTRYQWQYVHRARSIFAAEESAGQVAYSGLFKKPGQINSQLILAAEALTQNRCIEVLGPKAVMFGQNKIPEGVTVSNIGNMPQFLK